MAGVAVRLAIVAAPNATWQMAPPVPHARPPPLTDPPAGAGEMVSWKSGVPPVGVNSAPQVRGPFNATHRLGFEPEQSPVQAVNV